jgi:hypothetical protein
METPEAFAADELACLLTAIQRDVTLEALILPEEYFYASLPLCVIDAVFSIGVTYTSTRNTVIRWCESQGWDRLRGPETTEQTIDAFVDRLRSQSADDLAITAFGNRQRTSAKSGILKAEAVLRFAEVLQAHGVNRLGDTDDPERNAAIEAAVRRIPGQASGISFEYFLMLAGSDQFVKADRMICRYVAAAIGKSAVSPSTARSLLLAAARSLQSIFSDLTPRALDYALWDLQRRLPSAA